MKMARHTPKHVTVIVKYYLRFTEKQLLHESYYRMLS